MPRTREQRMRQLKNAVKYAGVKNLVTGEWLNPHLILITDWGDDWQNENWIDDILSRHPVVHPCRARWLAESNRDETSKGWGNNPDEAIEDLVRQHPEYRDLPIQHLG